MLNSAPRALLSAYAAPCRYTGCIVSAHPSSYQCEVGRQLQAVACKPQLKCVVQLWGLSWWLAACSLFTIIIVAGIPDSTINSLCTAVQESRYCVLNAIFKRC